MEIAVFKKGQRTNSIASERISTADAQYMVDCGVARWVNSRYNSIQMMLEAASCKVRDRSAQMGPRVIELNAMGDAAAMALVAAWKPYMLPIAA
jgi:hypothetical protein